MDKRISEYKKILMSNKDMFNAINECEHIFNDMLDIKNEYAKVFLNIFAPAIYEYVAWLINDAVIRKIKKVYFLARDGYIPYRVAKIILDQNQYNIDVEYLKVSRASLRKAEYSLIGEEAVDMICSGGIDITLDKVLARTELTLDEKAILADKIPEVFKNKVLSFKQLKELGTFLKQDKDFLNSLMEHSRKNLGSVRKYLFGKGISSESRIAIADSGWIGTIQRSIKRLTDADIEGYYFGLYELPVDIDVNKYHCYYFGPNREHGNIRRKIYFSNCLYEAVISAPEEMTIAYDELGNPIGSGVNNPNSDYILLGVRLSELYASRIGMKEAVNGDFDTRLGIVEKLLSLLMGNPSEREAEIFGSLLFCDDILDGNFKTVANDWNEEELRKQRFVNRMLILTGFSKKELHDSAWSEASIVKLKGQGSRRLNDERLIKLVRFIRKSM